MPLPGPSQSVAVSASRDLKAAMISQRWPSGKAATCCRPEMAPSRAIAVVAERSRRRRRLA